jgi:hypothetical protein
MGCAIGASFVIVFIEPRAAAGVGETHDIQTKNNPKRLYVGLIDLALSPFSRF